jgi:WD40 repeat protein
MTNCPLLHVFGSGSDSARSRIKFWDLRRPKLPLKILTGHTHWIYSARFNRFHDQLLCSGGSDAQVNLWSVLSISSAPLGELEVRLCTQALSTEDAGFSVWSADVTVCLWNGVFAVP